MSVTDNVALREPAAPGVNTTLITQLWLTPEVARTKLAVHVVPVPRLKSLALVPEKLVAGAPKVTEVFPVLVTVTVIAELAMFTV